MKRLVRLIEDFKRLLPRNLKEDKNNNLSHNQIYPSGKNLIEILNSNAKENPNSYIDDNMHIKRFKVAQILKSLDNAIF